MTTASLRAAALLVALLAIPVPGRAQAPSGQPAPAAPAGQPAPRKPAPAQAAPKPAAPLTGFAAVLKEAVTGRRFAGLTGQDIAGDVMLAKLQKGEWSVQALPALAGMPALDRLVAEACPKAKPPSQLVREATPFLLTGDFAAKTVPAGAAITTGSIAGGRLQLATGRFLVYSMVLTGAKVAPAPIVDVRAHDLADCRASGEALSLVDGSTADGTIVGQGLVVIGGEPVWVAVGRAEAQTALSLQPLNRRVKGYRVADGWKFVSAP